MSVQLSVVLPIFNEEENLVILLEEITAAVTPLGMEWEIVAVDDGSTDGSLKTLMSEKGKRPLLRVVALAENCGQSAAIDAGIRAARGQHIVLLDADLQNDPADIPKLIDLAGESGADMVIGIRVERRDSRWKRAQSRIGNGVRNLITGDAVTDTGCSLKLFRREVFSRLPLFQGMHRFLPTLVRMQGYKVIEVPVNHRPRRFGVSKYTAWNRALRGLVDCFAVRWLGRRKVRYRAEEH